MTATKNYLESLLRNECPDSSYNPLRLPGRGDAPEIVLASAAGTTVTDVNGKTYRDCISGFGSLILGHGHESYKNTLRAHLESNSPCQGLGDVYASEAKVKLIERLIEITPKHLTKAALAVTGSQAVELALKTAYIKTKKSGVISFSGAYHGLDMGVLALEGRGSFKEPFRHAMGGQKIDHLPFGCDPEIVRSAALKLSQSHGGIAAIIVEPLQGRGGIVHAPQGWIESIKNITAEYGCLLILDEIWTGMGRTGDWLFADTAADLVCIGKALGGGMPISAVLGTSDAFSGWPENKAEALHTGTFFGHALSCKVALATIEATDKVYTQKKSIDFKNRIVNLLPKEKGFEVFGQGHLCGIKHAKLTPKAIMHDLAHAGILALPSGPAGDTLSLTPALTITAADTIELSEKIITICNIRN